ncbi:hypothetical protein ACH5RR_037905 [Cinchona calisaya]|uniref:START domain-containing protein n=1 Tax=Cinchona calisaya TaxID=153742 RepID=A0ABD2Y9V9_9GENT
MASNLGTNNISRASDLLMSVSVCSEVNKAKISNLATVASEELLQMALEKEPLWLIDKDKKTEVLNIVEYKRRFASLDATLEEVIRVITTQGTIDLPDLNENAEFHGVSNENLSRLRLQKDASLLETEASRAVGVVSADPLSLVNMFMEVDHWSSVFSNVVSKASILGFLLTGEKINPDGVLQVVTADFHVPSPLCRTQEICFARYFRQLDSNTWLVVDVSLDSIFPHLALRCQRKPSGCLIQALHERSSKVTWVENNAVNNGSVHNMFRHVFTSGLAFGANQWVATLEREFDRIAIMEKQFDQFPAPKSANGLQAGNKNLLKLAGRMVRSYNANMSSYSENPWRLLPIISAEDILVKTSFNLDDPGSPHGVSVTIATSVWLQIPQKDVFNFLCNTNNRKKWDVLSYGRGSREILHISCGRNPENVVSLLLAEPRPNKKIEMVYVQETFSDSTGLYVVYAPIEMAAMHHILEGKDSDIVSILPCGFAVLPANRSAMSEETENIGGGSILSIAFEVMDEGLSSSENLPPQSVITAYSIIRTTVDLIKAALLPIHD